MLRFSADFKIFQFFYIILKNLLKISEKTFHKMLYKNFDFVKIHFEFMFILRLSISYFRGDLRSGGREIDDHAPPNPKQCCSICENTPP